MPRVQDYRDQGRTNGDPARAQALDCMHCSKTYGHATRARWHCGRMPLKDLTGHGWEWECGAPWTPEPGRQPDETEDEYLQRTLCPGFLVAQPKVHEAARARTWRHELHDFCEDEPTRMLFDAIDAYRGAQSEMQAEQMARNREGK